MSKKTVRLNVDIPKKLHEALKRRAFEAETSIASLVRKLITQYVDSAQTDSPATGHPDSALLNQIRKVLVQRGK